MSGHPSSNIEIRKDLVYATHDGVELAGDLYLPGGPGPFPALIAAHGGGWQYGARNELQHWGPYLAQRGYALFSASYRLSKEGQKAYPHAVHDVRAAVQFIRGNAAGFGIAADRLGMIGISAGAQLVSLVALAGDGAPFAGAYPDDAFARLSTQVKAVVGIYGVYDFLDQHRHDLVARPRDQIVVKFLGETPMVDRRLYFEASPINYAITANNRTAFLLSYGTQDDIVNREGQSEAFLLALKQAQFFARTFIVQGAPHFWAGDPIDEPASFSGLLAPHLVRFLAEKL
jgi:acetyl esterase/lipase